MTYMLDQPVDDHLHQKFGVQQILGTLQIAFYLAQIPVNKLPTLLAQFTYAT